MDNLISYKILIIIYFVIISTLALTGEPILIELSACMNDIIECGPNHENTYIYIYMGDFED
jgi:hypothetical protein